MRKGAPALRLVHFKYPGRRRQQLELLRGLWRPTSYLFVVSSQSPVVNEKALIEDSSYRWEKFRRHTSDRGSPTVENKEPIGSAHNGQNTSKFSSYSASQNADYQIELRLHVTGLSMITRFIRN